MENTSHPTHNVPNAFIQKHQANVIGVLQGCDRLRLQGTLRSLYHPAVMEYYLRKCGVLWKDFKPFVTGITLRVRQAAEALAKGLGRPMLYFASSATTKENYARDIQQRDQVRSGLISVFSCVEPCRTWFVRGDRTTQRLHLELRWGKCVHLYFYWLHEQLGFLSVRLQTWFPFLIQVCLNGREWLARQMDAAGMAYRRQDNCFPWIADIPGAQRLMDEQLRTHWARVLDPLVEQCHPLHKEITRPIQRDYYWTVAESEYATDVMFKSRQALERIYPALIHHGVMSFGSEQVMRFLTGAARLGQHDKVVSDRRRGKDGVRIKHWLNVNSIKLYDKGTVLRDEVTINEPKDFRVWRGPESDPAGKKCWRILRRSIADLHRRAQVSRAATERYLTALAAVHDPTPLCEEAVQVCQPVRRHRRRYRALNPFAEADAKLLEVVNRGEFALNGFRNRDLRAHLYTGQTEGAELRRRCGAVSRKLALLRAHGLIARVPKTHRYVLTNKGRRLITALLTARKANIEQLTALAA